MKTLIKYLSVLTLFIVSAFAVPVTPVAPDLSASSDSKGVNIGSDTDNITNEYYPVFDGNKIDGQTIRLYRDGNLVSTSSTVGTTYSLSSDYLSADGSYNFSVTADDNDGSGESPQSPSLTVTIDHTSPTITVSLDPLSDSGTQDGQYTNDTTPTFIGTVSEQSSITINNVNISSSSNWSYTYPVLTGSPLGSYYYIPVSAEDIAGNNSSSSTSVYIDTSSYITIDSITSEVISNYNGNNEYLVDGIYINISTDIYNVLSININGTDYSFDYPDHTFIKNSDLTLVDGVEYNITMNTNVTDDAGNTPPPSSFLYRYDAIGNDASNAKPIGMGSVNSNLFDTTDVDYFLLNVPKKGKLSVSSTAHKVTLKSINGVDLPSQSPAVLEEGAYIIEVSSENNSTGNYTLTSSITEYGKETDIKATPSAILDSSFNINYTYSEFISIDGDILYTSEANAYKLFYTSTFANLNNDYIYNKFVVKNGDIIYVSGNNMYIKTAVNGDYVSTTLTNTAESVSVIDNTAYVLVGSAVERYDISNKSNITKIATDIALPTNVTTYGEILAYQDGTSTYMYVKDTNNIMYLFDVTDPVNVTTLKVFNKYGINDFAIDNGLLYISASTGYIFVYDIKTDATKPRQILEFSTPNIPGGIDAHGGYLYISDTSYGNISRYKLDFDFDDEMPSNSYELSRIKLDSTISVNKFADFNLTKDIDIFRVDTEYFGTLSFSTLGVNSTDLNITVASDSNFSTILVDEADLKNTSVSAGLTALEAGTYYVKIGSNDFVSFDDYNLTTTFTRTDTEPDRLLHISSNSLSPISLSVVTNGVLDDINDIDIFKVIIPSDGDFNISVNDVNKSVSLHTLSASDTTTYSYAALSADIGFGSIKAGIYYVQVSGNIAGAYSLTPSYTSHDSTDEYLENISVSNIQALYSANTNSVDMDGVFINSARPTGVGRLAADNYFALSNKDYLSQVSDGDYIYAIYRDKYSFDGDINFTTSIGIDKFEYVNDSKTVLVDSNMISGQNSETFGYKLKYAQGNLYILKDDGWFIYDTLNNTISATQFLSSDYVDFEIFDSNTYAVTSSSVEIIGSAISNSFANISSVEVVDGIVYVGTTDKGIKALDVDTLNLLKEIGNLRNITSLESIGNTLYILENKSVLSKVEIERDFGDDFANAKLIFDAVTTTARISSDGEKDYFKIDMDYTGSITTTLNGAGVCELYDSSLNLKGNCNNSSITDLASGTYYLMVTNATATSYDINVDTSLTNGDAQDTTRFYNGAITDLADQSTQSFSGTIDGVGDTDMFKVYFDTSGLLELNASNVNVVIVYENDTPVPTNADGSYKIENSGDYFIKVDGADGVVYNVDATFTSVLDDKYIDNADSENERLSTLSTNGSSSMVISSGTYVYMVDDVDGLSIIDMSTPKSPAITSRVNLIGTPKDIFLDGSVIYVALGSDGFAVVDVSDPAKAYLYAQTNINVDVSSIVSRGGFVYVSGSDTLKKYDLSIPNKPSLVISAHYIGASEILLDNDTLLLATSSELARVNQSDLVKSDSVSISSINSLAKDGEYIFYEDSNQNINILNLSDMSDTGKTITLTDTRIDTNTTSSSINHIYPNNKILYISKSYGYEIVEYKDLNEIISSPFGNSNSDKVNSIAFSNNSLVLAKDSTVLITEATPDYADTLNSQNVNLLDMGLDINSTEMTGQFSSSDDIDVFEYVNNYYTGTLNINVTAVSDVNITIYDENGNFLKSSINSLSYIVNAKDIYVAISSQNSYLDSYVLTQTYEIDGVYDVLDDSFTYSNITQNGSLNGNLYGGGADKDFYELYISERGSVNFDTNSDTKVKVSLLYKSGTLIASNYDEETQTLETEFKADLSSGDYIVLVENFEPSSDEAEHDYTINTTHSSIVDELDMQSGASSLLNLSAFSYVDRHSYRFWNGNLSRMSNILQEKQELLIAVSGIDNESVFTLHSFNDGTQEVTYISEIVSSDSSLNRVSRVVFDNIDGLYLDYDGYDVSEITDEVIMKIDESEYVYYYDEDSLYITSLHTFEQIQQLAISNLNIVDVQGNYMYLATDSDVRIVDISDKTDIDNAKTLFTINETNTESIDVDEDANRLFVAANNKIFVYNISDKERVELLSEYTIGFNEKDLWYEGTPSSMYMLNDKLYTTIKGIGIVIFDIDEFNALSIYAKALNLGENVSDVYTFNGDAINYVVDNELRVYFLSDNVLDSDTAATYSIVDNGDISEGSKVAEGCFIATAAYGSYFDNEVKVLRDFRDDYLKTNLVGRLFVDAYYSLSPPIARSISDNESAKAVVRVLLTPIVYIIKYPTIFVVMMFMLFFIAYKNMKLKSTRVGRI